MASIKYHKSFTNPVAFTVGLLTLMFCLDSGADKVKFQLPGCHIIDMMSFISS